MLLRVQFALFATLALSMVLGACGSGGAASSTAASSTWTPHWRS
jgi:hypothetical protein